MQPQTGWVVAFDGSTASRREAATPPGNVPAVPAARRAMGWRREPPHHARWQRHNRYWRTRGKRPGRDGLTRLCWAGLDPTW